MKEDIIKELNILYIDKELDNLDTFIQNDYVFVGIDPGFVKLLAFSDSNDKKLSYSFKQNDIVFDKKTGYNFIPELFQTNVTKELICKQQPCVPCNKP